MPEDINITDYTLNTTDSADTPIFPYSMKTTGSGGGSGEVTSVNGRKGAVTGLAEQSAVTLSLNGKANFPASNNHVPIRSVSGVQASIPFSVTATGSSMAVRGSGGVLAVGTPTAAEHATTKAYVDNLVGKSQVITANGAIDINATAVIVSSGDMFTLVQPTLDGRVITLLNNAEIALTFNGHIGGAASSTWTTPAGNRVIHIMSVQIAPDNLTWFILAENQE